MCDFKELDDIYEDLAMINVFEGMQAIVVGYENGKGIVALSEDFVKFFKDCREHIAYYVADENIRKNLRHRIDEAENIQDLTELVQRCREIHDWLATLIRRDV